MQNASICQKSLLNAIFINPHGQYSSAYAEPTNAWFDSSSCASISKNTSDAQHQIQNREVLVRSIHQPLIHL